MEKDVQFWFTVMARGLLALMAGTIILVVPRMTETILLLPFAVVVTILSLGAYGVIDSTFVLVSSFMCSSKTARQALRLQGAIGITVGILLMTVAFDRVEIRWFLLLAALQALSLAVGEAVVAHHQGRRSVSLWNYAAAAGALLFACAYCSLGVVYARRLTYRELSWLVYAYLVALGISLCLTAARMIYADFHPQRSNPEAALEA